MFSIIIHSYNIYYCIVGKSLVRKSLMNGQKVITVDVYASCCIVHVNACVRLTHACLDHSSVEVTAGVIM